MFNEECQSLKAEYEQLCHDFETFSDTNPEIDGAKKLQRRIERDLTALVRFIDQHPESEEDPIWIGQRRNQVGLQQTLLKNQNVDVKLQGFRNNFTNYSNKLRVAQRLDDVIALGKIFQYPLAPGIDEAWRRAQSSNDPGEVVKTEVDIVANNGSTWIHVRSVKIPDVNSLNWTGLPGHHKGLEQKLKDMKRVAQSSEQWIRWRPPDVAVYCPEILGEDVLDEIKALDVVAISGGADYINFVRPGGSLSGVMTDDADLTSLPPPPAPPTTANLDVTTLCALVSEVSNTEDPSSPEISQWSERVSHWKECVEHEKRERLLPTLAPLLHNRTLITTEHAVVQFGILLKTLSGPREMERWNALLSTLTVFKTEDEKSWLSSRVSGIEDLTELQYSVFGLGDSQKALTITCNQKLVKKLKHNGIHLECYVHRPVWLTGL